MIGLACLMFGLVLWAWWPGDPSGAAGRRLGQAVERGAGPPAWLAPLLGVLGGLAVVGLLVPGLLVWVVPGVVVSATAGWLLRRGRAERARRAAADEVVHACQGLASQLKVGDIPARALAAIAADAPLLAPVAAAQAIGGDVPAALRAVARRPGCGGRAGLARSWQLCETTGAPVAQAAERVAEGLRMDAAAERLVAGELAAPRATGKLLAGLPLLGIAMGYLTGGDPVDFLINQPLGRIALAAAICLVCAGLVWTTLLGSAPVEVAE